MTVRTKLKAIAATVFFGCIVGAGVYYLLMAQLNQNQPSQRVADHLFGWQFPAIDADQKIAYSSLRVTGGSPEGLPVRLKIPTIGVDSAIEDALITSDGRMDIPVGSLNVAWFALGPQPGQAGSAVVGGHYGINNNVPFVFYDLNKLRSGDKIYVVNDRGDSLTFVVRSIKSFERDADATTVFTSNDGLAHLNLITCEGIWNRVDDSYPQRLVVFTDAIPTESPAVVSQAPAKPALPMTALTSTKPAATPALTTELTQAARAINYLFGLTVIAIMIIFIVSRINKKSR